MRNLLCLPYIAVRKDLIIGLQANSLFGMSNNSLNPSLDDLAIFLAVTEAGGFRTAARRLGLSPSTVSETITRLETRLGAPLLTRTTRSVMPTEAGRALSGRLPPLPSAVRLALDGAPTPPPAGAGRPPP